MATGCHPSRTHRRTHWTVLVGISLAAGQALARQDKTVPVTEPISGTTISIDLVPIPAGKVTTADPADPTKTVEIAVGPFYMSRTEVTWDQYDIFVNRLDEPADKPDVDATSHPSKPYISYDRGFGHAGYAAIGMSYKGADLFCSWLSTKTGHKYRLATEAEWEYAARAGASGDFAGGLNAASLSDIAWFRDNSEEKTHPVGTKKPNPWGLFDMTGNAAEWVVGRDAKPAVKGGSFQDATADLKITARVLPTRAWNATDPQIPKSTWWLADCRFVGFRIVRELDKAPQTVTPSPEIKPIPSPTSPSPSKERFDDHPAPK